MPTEHRGYPNDLTSDSPNTPHVHINALADAIDEDIHQLANATARIQVAAYTFPGALSAGTSALRDVPHNFGAAPDFVLVQVLTNARLVVAVNSFNGTTARLEFFNPSAANSSTPCKIQLISGYKSIY